MDGESESDEDSSQSILSYCDEDSSPPSNVCANRNVTELDRNIFQLIQSFEMVSIFSDEEGSTNIDQTMSVDNEDSSERLQSAKGVPGHKDTGEKSSQSSGVCTNADQRMSSGRKDSLQMVQAYVPNISSERISGNKSLQSLKVCAHKDQRMSSSKPEVKGNSSQVTPISSVLRSNKNKPQPSKVRLHTNQGMSASKPGCRKKSSQMIRIPASSKRTTDKSQPSKVHANTDQKMPSGDYIDEQKKNTTLDQNSEIEVLDWAYDFMERKKETPIVPREVPIIVHYKRIPKWPINIFNILYSRDFFKAFRLHDFVTYLIHVKYCPILLYLSKNVATFTKKSLVKANIKCIEILKHLNAAHNLLFNRFAISADYISVLSERDAYMHLITDSAVRKKFRSYGFLMIEVAADVFAEVLKKNVDRFKKLWKATFKDLYKSLYQFIEKIKNPDIHLGYWFAISLFLSVDIEDVPLNLLFQLKEYCWYIFRRCLKYPQRPCTLKIWNILIAFCNQNSTESPLEQDTLKIWDFLTDVSGQSPDLKFLLLGYDFREIEQKHNCYCIKSYLPTGYPLMINYSLSMSEYFQSDIRPRQFYSTHDFLYGGIIYQKLNYRVSRRKMIPNVYSGNSKKVSHKATVTRLSHIAKDISSEKSKVHHTSLKRKRLKSKKKKHVPSKTASLSKATRNVSSKTSISLTSQVPLPNNVEIYYKAMFSENVLSNAHNYYCIKSKYVISSGVNTHHLRASKRKL